MAPIIRARGVCRTAGPAGEAFAVAGGDADGAVVIVKVLSLRIHRPDYIGYTITDSQRADVSVRRALLNSSENRTAAECGAHGSYHLDKRHKVEMRQEQARAGMFRRRRITIPSFRRRAIWLETRQVVSFSGGSTDQDQNGQRGEDRVGGRRGLDFTHEQAAHVHRSQKCYASGSQTVEEARAEHTQKHSEIRRR